MVLKSSFFCLILIALCLSTFGEAPATAPSTQPTTAPRPLPPNIQLKDGFGAQLWVVDKQFIEDWSKPEPPKLTPIEKLSNGQTGQIVVLFTGARGNASGKANVSADVTLRKPDGSVGYEQKGLDILKDAPAPDAKLISLGGATLAFEPEKTDPSGTWTIEAAVTDQVSGTVVNLRYTIQILVTK